MSEINILALPVEQVRPLRLAVLRPGMPAETAEYSGDEAATTLHLGVQDLGRVVAVASIFAEDCPLRSEAAGWRLRGVATLPGARRRGYGGELVRRCLAYARSAGGELVWCNGRTLVRSFYEGLGFHTLGEEFTIPVSGPHYVFVYDLPSKD